MGLEVGGGGGAWETFRRVHMPAHPLARTLVHARIQTQAGTHCRDSELKREIKRENTWVFSIMYDVTK